MPDQSSLTAAGGACLLAMVTGASSGIGYGLAKLFAEDGFGLILAADTSLGETVQSVDDVARAGHRAAMRGDGDVVAGMGDKIRAAMAAVTPHPCWPSSIARWPSPAPETDLSAFERQGRPAS